MTFQCNWCMCFYHTFWLNESLHFCIARTYLFSSHNRVESTTNQDQRGRKKYAWEPERLLCCSNGVMRQGSYMMPWLVGVSESFSAIAQLWYAKAQTLQSLFILIILSMDMDKWVMSCPLLPFWSWPININDGTCPYLFEQSPLIWSKVPLIVHPTCMMEPRN